MRRSERDVTIAFRDRPSMVFDEVAFACHGDQVVPLLADPNGRQREVLSNFTTTINTAWLHSGGARSAASTARTIVAPTGSMGFTRTA